MALPIQPVRDLASARVLTVGDVMVDVTVVMSAELGRGTDTPARIRTGWGGSAANVAAWLAASGVPAAFIGRTGEDMFGRAAVAELRAAGVKVYVEEDADRPTGTCVVLVHPDGERSMLPDAGANAALLPEHLDPDAFDWASHLHLSAYALFDPYRRAAGLAALARAQAEGLSVSVDAASAGPLAAAGGQHFLEWTAGADLLLANEDEAHVIARSAGMPDHVRPGPAPVSTRTVPGRSPGSTGIPPGFGHDPELAAGALTAHYPAVVVKLGPRGAIWAERGGDILRVAGPAAKVVDTTGAGDAFAAGFLAAWLLGAEPRAGLDAGTGQAARAIAQLGARPPL